MSAVKMIIRTIPDEGTNVVDDLIARFQQFKNDRECF